MLTKILETNAWLKLKGVYLGFVKAVAWETQTREAPEFVLLDYKMREADKGKTHGLHWVSGVVYQALELELVRSKGTCWVRLGGVWIFLVLLLYVFWYTTVSHISLHCIFLNSFLPFKLYNLYQSIFKSLIQFKSTEFFTFGIYWSTQ